MPDSSEDRLKDVATLTRAVENVIRKLMPFLIGRISLVRLQEMVRTIFVEEAEYQFQEGDPEKNISLTELALVSGLDTRTITKIRNSESYRRPFFQRDSFLIDLTPGSSVLDIWSSEEPYFDFRNGVPRELDVSGTRLSFERLFDDNIKTRGVTASSLLTRLIESGSVRIDEDRQKLRLLELTYLPVGAADQVGAIEMGFGAVAKLLDTLLHNLIDVARPEEKRFQRGAWSLRLRKKEIALAKAELSRLLKQTDDEARRILRAYEATGTEECVAGGVGYFYFEQKVPVRTKDAGLEVEENEPEIAG